MESNRITYDNPHFSKPITADFQADPKSAVAPNSKHSLAMSVGERFAVSDYIAASIADSTRRAYRTDLADFIAWGGTLPSTVEQVASYLADRAVSLSPITLARRLVAIGRAHASQGFPDPSKADLVRSVLRGIRRKHGAAQRQVAPVMKQDLLDMLPLMTGLKGVRDCALIILGFAAALRRSELVALDVTDIAFVNEGLTVRVRKSKTDQEQIGRTIGVPWGRTAACPVKAVRAWMDQAQISSGFLFRSVSKGGNVGNGLSAHAVALIVKSYAQAIGHESSTFSGHSLRSGLATSAAKAGVSANKIMAQTGHKSIEMLSRYIRDGNLFVNNAGGIL